MRKINTISGNPYIIEPIEPEIPEFTGGDYEERLELLIGRMKDNKITHAVVYADREHFSNMEYLTGFDPRFEEALLIVSQEGEMTILIGNEGWDYSFKIPLDVKRMLYQNFSLQGQPRESLRPLYDIFKEAGMNRVSKIGVIGFKYFEPKHMKDHSRKVDIPSYIVEELAEAVPRERIINFTGVMTNLVSGIRMVLRNPKEIAYYEYVANKASNCVINMLKGLKPGITELEASQNARFDAWPICMFPIINFGADRVQLGLSSPGHRELKEGDIITLCYGIRGSLVSKSGLAVSGVEKVPENLTDFVEDFYQPFFRALVTWYESIHVGADCGEVFDKVMAIIGDREKFGVVLNPGHNIGGDEWVNSPFFKGSKYMVRGGYYLQADIIASSPNPFRQAIAEDGIVVADESLRAELRLRYPDVFGRIQKRRDFMKTVMGINLSDDVLPLSNCQAVMHPYMLDTKRFFAIEA